MKKVDFFCIGAQKAGTTLLHDILNQHTDIYLPTEKEAHFFDVNEVYLKGLPYYFDTYFSTISDEKIIGNINPNLQVEKRSIDRIIDCFGTEPKMLFFLRNPVSRAYSHYLMSKKRGYEPLNFLEALEKENSRILNPISHKGYESEELGHFEKNHYGYVSRGLYSETISYLFEKFPKENIKVFVMEEFLNDKENIIKEILSFLNVEHEDLNLNLKSNPAQKAKFLWLSKFLNTSSELKDGLKQIFPETLRKSLKTKVYNRNFKTIPANERELPYSYQDLKTTYFSEDLKRLEQVLGRRIEIWD